MSKTVAHLGEPRRKPSGGAGSGYLERAKLRVNRLFRAFRSSLRKPGNQSAKTASGSRGKPPKHQDDSIGARTLLAELQKRKRFFNRLRRGAPPVSERGGDIRATHFRRNPAFAESSKNLPNAVQVTTEARGLPLASKGFLHGRHEPHGPGDRDPKRRRRSWAGKGNRRESALWKNLSSPSGPLTPVRSAWSADKSGPKGPTPRRCRPSGSPPRSPSR